MRLNHATKKDKKEKKKKKGRKRSIDFRVEWRSDSPHVYCFVFVPLLQAIWRCSHQEQVRNERWQGGRGGRILH